MRKTLITEQDFISQCGAAGVKLPLASGISALRTPLTICNRTAHNRILYQPMEGCDCTPDGAPGELTRRRYLRFAAGGAGIIWMEAAAVLEEGRANPRQLLLRDKNLSGIARLCDDMRETAVKAGNPVPLIILQLTHSGRYSRPNGVPEPLIAYHCPPLEENISIPDGSVVSDGYLRQVESALVNGALTAEKLGFDGADIKCCHRYLLSELLSAYNRPGEYGGPLENRARLLLDATRGAASLCGKDFIVAVRMNAYDGFEYPWGFGVRPGGGLEPCLDEAKQLGAMLHASGVSLINVTMGNPYKNPHVNRPYATGGYVAPEEPVYGVRRLLEGAAEIAAASGTAVSCSGLSYAGAMAPRLAEAYIADNRFAFAGFGRETLACPDIAKRILTSTVEPDKLCICCGKCTEIMRAPGGTPGCVVRDGGVYAPLWRSLCGKK